MLQTHTDTILTSNRNLFFFSFVVRDQIPEQLDLHWLVILYLVPLENDISLGVHKLFFIYIPDQRVFFEVKIFQTAHQKLQKLDRFKDIKNMFASRNDLAFIASEVQFVA
jgi:hypothetical protein